MSGQKGREKSLSLIVWRLQMPVTMTSGSRILLVSTNQKLAWHASTQAHIGMTFMSLTLKKGMATLIWSLLRFQILVGLVNIN